MNYRTAERKAKSRTINRLVGMNARAIREVQGITQIECSRLLAGAHESYWRSIETGHKDMSLLRVVEVSEVLGCTVGQLMEGV